MDDLIFSSTAPKLWGAGYSAFPCRPGGKEPAIKNQYSYSDNIASAERQRDWLTSFPNGNIGVPLGRKLPDGTVFGAMDVDMNEYSRFIGGTIGYCPVIKRSPRGLTFFGRFPANSKSSKIKRFDGTVVCDVLITKAYTIIAPSIHPSGQPYEWAGDKALWECTYEELPYVE